MKTPTFPNQLARILLLGGVLLALVASAAAQGNSSNAPGQLKKIDPTPAEVEANERVSIATAKSQAKGGNVVGAEQALIPLVVAQPSTAAWHIETAQRLVQLAEQLAREGQPANVAALVTSALQHVAQADDPKEDASTRSAAKMLAGFIHERFLANSRAALASYQAAAQLTPDSASAKEAADRQQKNDDTFRDKGKPAK